MSAFVLNREYELQLQIICNIDIVEMGMLMEEFS